MDRSKTNIKIEIFAGIASFLAAAYILTVNPNNILAAGSMDPRWASVFIATAFTHCVLIVFSARDSR